MRYWNLSTRLAERFSVNMADPTHADAEPETVEHTPNCIEKRIPKTGRYMWWHRFLNRTSKFAECSALVATLAAPRHRELRAEARRITRDADIVIHSCPFLWKLYPRPRRGQLLVYDSYNVEANMARDMFGSGLWAKWAVGRIRRLEGGLCRAAHVILACSHEDAEGFVELYGVDRSKIVIVPNGVDVEAVRPAPEQREAGRERLGLSADRPAAFFIGSFHPPNTEAAEYIVGSVAPQVPEADFLIAGRVCQSFEGLELPPNVRMLGLVDEQTKADLFAATDVALNPMFSGSGTNLKMLEHLAAGQPILTTPLGARGLDLEHGRHAWILPERRYVRGLKELLANAGARRALGHHGRELAESRFSWQVIGRELADLLEMKISPRILYLNDYQVSPVISGGCQRLNAVATELSKNVLPVTLLTLTTEESARRVSHSARYEELNIPRSGAHRAVDAFLNRRLGVAPDDATAIAFHWLTPAYRRALERETIAPALIVLGHTFMVRQAERFRDRLPIFYDSHNAEFSLKRQLYPSSLVGRWLKSVVRRGERDALQMSFAASCVAQGDLEAFVSELGAGPEKLFIADNGVDCSRLTPVDVDVRPRLRQAIGMGTRPAAIFLGSGHPPNADAARFLFEEVAPANPDALFLIAGGVCGWFSPNQVPKNVVLMGMVSDAVKDFLLLTADVALNPVFRGSGTNIKLMDYLSAGLPVICTPVGARGLPANANGVVVSEPDEFGPALAELLGDLDRRRELALGARELAVRQFDWPIALGPQVNHIRGELQEIDESRS
ncbi:glycosyltransferase family 4 protein [bacterium]|nr:glycosyltransferase family 4 protein [bacterium]